MALAWCTQAPRGTSDIDVNLFVPPAQLRTVLAALPAAVTWTDRQVDQLDRHGQARLSWANTPVDIFLSTTPFHETAMRRVHIEPFAGRMIPFLSCGDLAVFKAFFDRRRDWADLEDMITAGSLDIDAVIDVLTEHLGADDGRIATLRSLQREIRPMADVDEAQTSRTAP